jgi:putative membrane protein
MWYGGPNGWAGWLAMSLMMVLFWGAIIALVVWLVRTSRSDAGGRHDATRDDAVSILRERFARGEIDARELAERMSVLEDGSPRSGDAGTSQGRTD